jgi:RNA polymerase sigma-70 factor (ECF subfamily)
MVMADPAATSTVHEDLFDPETASAPMPRRPPLAAETVFRKIFEEHAASVHRTLRYLGVADSDLMDASQEVFLVVNRRHREFEGRSSLSTWIHEICIRVAFSTRRRWRRRAEDLVGELPEASVEADQDTRIEQRDRQGLLNDLLDGLDDFQRQIIVLHEIERLPMREVAEIVGCPLQTAYSRRNAALERMRARLSGGRYSNEDL